jgi:hypothetical protein
MAGFEVTLYGRICGDHRGRNAFFAHFVLGRDRGRIRSRRPATAAFFACSFARRFLSFTEPGFGAFFLVCHKVLSSGEIPGDPHTRVASDEIRAVTDG